MNTVLRWALESDMPAILRMERGLRGRAFRCGRSPDLSGGGEHRDVLVAEREGTVVAYLSFIDQFVAESGEISIKSFGSLPGAGELERGLFRAACGVADRLGAVRLLTPCDADDRSRREALLGAGFRHAFDLLDMELLLPCGARPVALAKPPTIRPATDGDVDALARAYRLSFQAQPATVRLSASELDRELESSTLLREGALVVPRNRGCEAFVLTHLSAAEEGEIAAIGVIPSRRRRGLGAALLRAALDALENRSARRVRLRVSSSNRSALSLYRRFGFACVGTAHVFALGVGGIDSDSGVGLQPST